MSYKATSFCQEEITLTYKVFSGLPNEQQVSIPHARGGEPSVPSGFAEAGLRRCGISAIGLARLRCDRSD